MRSIPEGLHSLSALAGGGCGSGEASPFFHPSFLVLHSPSQPSTLALREGRAGEQGYVHCMDSQASHYL